MNTRQTVAEITRRLPDLRKRDVQEVFDVLVELWRAELARSDGAVHITGLGTLYVEVHPVRANGVVRQVLFRKYGLKAPVTLQRRSIRFRPYEALRRVMKEEKSNDE